MDRRRFLAACSVGLVGLAGCGSSTDGTEPTDDTPRSTPPGTTESPAESSPTEPDATEESAEPPELEPVWTVSELSGTVSLAVPEGARAVEPGSIAMHAATTAGELRQVTPADGSVGWRRSTRVAVDGEDGTGPRLFGIQRLGDALFTVAGDPAADEPYTVLTCRDAATGEQRWHDRRREILAPLALSDGRVYVAGEYLREPTDELGPSQPRSRSGRLRALDVESGTVEAEATIPSSFSVVTAVHGLYVQRQRPDDGARYSVVAFDGDLTRRWQVDTDSQVGRSLATTDEGVLYTVEGELAELDAGSGEPRWTVGGWADPPRSPDVLSDGAVYAGFDPVRRISPDGEVVHDLPAGVAGDAVAAPSTGRVYLDGNETVYRVDRTSGAVRWRYQPTGREYTGIAALPGEAVVAARGISAVTILDVLDGATGDHRGTVRPRRGVAEVNVAGGLVVVAGTDRIEAYDVSTVL